MASRSGGVEGPEFDGDPTAELPESFRKLMTQLLLYKSVFCGEWFERAGAEGPSQADFATIREETAREAADTSDVVHLWARFPNAAQGAEIATARAHQRLLGNLVNLKEGSTEAFLAVAMCAPTQELRKEFTRLADLDRKHADALRRALGARARHRPQEEPPDAAVPTGAHGGRARGGSLRMNVQACVERLRERGGDPARIIVSALALRHLRDEGAVDMERGLVCGLPADVDFGWIGECYSFVTRERVTLAEIVTEQRAPPQSERQIGT